MLLFAGELVHRGLRVDVVVVRRGGPLTRRLPPGATAVKLDARGVLPAMPAIASYLRRARPDAVYSTMAYCNIGVLLASRLGGGPPPVVVREAIVPLSAGHAGTFNARLIRRLIARVYPWAHAVIAVSQDVATELCSISERLRAKIAVLPTPVVSDDLLKEGDQPLEHPWFGPDAPPVVVGAGRLHPQKDFVTLMRAFAHVRRQRPLRLMVLGEGHERPELEALSRELGVAADVELPGFLDNPFPYVKRAAVFVLSSRYEGMPNALLQAMAFGTPVVSTDCPGGPREVLQGGRFGRLVSVGDVEGLAAALAATIGSPRRADAADYIRERFGTSAAAARYLDLLPSTGA
jgi:glycosyltransferase involved in cell wall biosynthesis